MPPTNNEIPAMAAKKNLRASVILVKESIDTYNRLRPHLSLNMKTPNFIHEKTVESNLNGLNKYL